MFGLLGAAAAVAAVTALAAPMALATVSHAPTRPHEARPAARGAVAGARTATRTWGKAILVPGTAVLNTGKIAETLSVSCASTGNCSAGGSYYVGPAQTIREPFVVSETDGKWGKAIEVPGIAALKTGKFAAVDQVSCASAGNCSAVGGFVVSETGGIWGNAIEIGGTAAGFATVSCASAGNCSVGGRDGNNAFVVNETRGTWGNAILVPGAAALGFGALTSLSCASAGNCSAGGTYLDATSGVTQVFVVSETDGTWGNAMAVPGYAALNVGAQQGLPLPEFDSVSCASAGNCSAGGTYVDDNGATQVFVVNETDGTWGQAIQVPGTAALNKGGTLFGGTSSVSCPSAGNCSAVGIYFDATGANQFVVNETAGTWGQAIEIPGTAALNGSSGVAGAPTVSCSSAGNCSAGGPTGHGQSFVVNETGGTWGQAILVPGLAALNAGRHAILTTLSCARGGTCSAGGTYMSNSNTAQAFVVSQTACQNRRKAPAHVPVP